VSALSDLERERLRDASAIVVGLGALGSPAALYLAQAGVARIGVVDPVEAPDAAVKLGRLNPDVQVEPYPARLDELNAEAIVAGADVALDCTNDHASARAIGDACWASGIPFVTAAVAGLTGHVLTVVPGETACHRCALPEDPGRPGGALGAVAGVIGSLQALEALKLLTGAGPPLRDELLRFDGLTLEQSRVPVARRDECPSCAHARAPQSV
jgi:molybdopterin/thiamine biosynthesis adenylyltransferase